MSDDGNDYPRSAKENSSTISASSNGGDEDGAPDDISRRRSKNRVNARRSREKKQLMLDTLQQEHWQLHQENKRIKGDNEKIREAIRSIRSLQSTGTLPPNLNNADNSNSHNSNSNSHNNNALQQPNNGNFANTMGNNGSGTDTGRSVNASQIFASNSAPSSGAGTGNPLYDLLANQLMMTQSQQQSPQQQQQQEMHEQQQQQQHEQQQQQGPSAGVPLLTQLLLANLLQQQGGGGLLNPLLSGILGQFQQQANSVPQHGTTVSQGTGWSESNISSGQQHSQSFANDGSNQIEGSITSGSNNTNQAIHPSQSSNSAGSNQSPAAPTPDGGFSSPALFTFLQQATGQNLGLNQDGGGINNHQVPHPSHSNNSDWNQTAPGQPDNGNVSNPALLALLQQVMGQQSTGTPTSNNAVPGNNSHGISSATSGADRDGPHS